MATNQLPGMRALTDNDRRELVRRLEAAPDLLAELSRWAREHGMQLVNVQDRRSRDMHTS